MCAGGVGKRDGGVDTVSDAAVGKHGPHVLHCFGHDAGLIVEFACPQRRGRDCAAFGEQAGDVEFAPSPRPACR